MKVFFNKDGKTILLRMIETIQENKDYLSELDGLIGDGDHGMNMNKGFTMFSAEIKDVDIGFTQGLYKLGDLLFSKIGGSMGPIYGSIFMNMAEEGERDTANDSRNDLQFDLNSFSAMLDAGYNSLTEIVEARAGDKTLMDTLIPANEALKNAAKEGRDFPEAIVLMKKAAEEGKESTRDLAAKYGRSSRLGDRSKGVLDAGAVSCCLILNAMADGIMEVLK